MAGQVCRGRLGAPMNEMIFDFNQIKTDQRCEQATTTTTSVIQFREGSDEVKSSTALVATTFATRLRGERLAAAF